MDEHPSRRSSTRQCLGTQIYNELESKANKQNMNSLGLWTSLNAVGFYEKQGYT